MQTVDGQTTVLLFEALDGGDHEPLVRLSYGDNPARFERAVLSVIERHHPTVCERTDSSAFSLTQPRDLLQGAVTPTVREDYLRLTGGTCALAVGDVHAVLDPLTGQGANVASYSASVIGAAIMEDIAFDALFCEKVAHRRSDFVWGASDWTNMLLMDPLPSHVTTFYERMTSDAELADLYASNFNHPSAQWDTFASPQRTQAVMDGRRPKPPLIAESMTA
jgi:hypothetical protein